MQEGWFSLIGVGIGFILGIIAFLIKNQISEHAKKNSVKDSLRFEIETNWELLNSHPNHRFKPLDKVLDGIINSGDLKYFDKEMQNNYIMMYYRELSYFKNRNINVNRETLKENFPEFYQTFYNLRSKIVSKDLSKRFKKFCKKKK